MGQVNVKNIPCTTWPTKCGARTNGAVRMSNADAILRIV